MRCDVNADIEVLVAVEFAATDGASVLLDVGEGEDRRKRQRHILSISNKKVRNLYLIYFR